MQMGGGVKSKVWSSNFDGWRGEGGGLYKYEGRNANLCKGGRSEAMQT